MVLLPTAELALRLWRCTILAAVMAACSLCAFADVRPSGLFTSGAVLQRDQPVPIWGTATDGERVTVAMRGRRATTVARKGRWLVTLAPMPAGGPYTLTIAGRSRATIANILVGDVYLCSGQSNMEWPLDLAANSDAAVAAAHDPLMRLYTVPRGVSDAPVDQVGGQWQPCTPDSARGFSAVALTFGRSLRRSQNVPIGLIESAWSGTSAVGWTARAALLANPSLASIVTAYQREKDAYRKALSEYDAARERTAFDAELPQAVGAEVLRRPADPTGKSSPSIVFNAMIAPLIPYGIRGVIWYQGESDTGSAEQYRVLFPALIASWRDEWKRPDLPFLFVQLAPFMRKSERPEESAWAELRDAQLATSRSVGNTGMAVITDAGDESDIHPRDKQVVGERLALLARAIVYGEAVEASGPLYESTSREGDKLVVHFSHTTGGLGPGEGQAVTGFAVAGEDGKYVNATAVVRGDTVVVSSPEVPSPVSVRYGWADYPEGNLRNGARLPASPFRTEVRSQK